MTRPRISPPLGGTATALLAAAQAQTATAALAPTQGNTAAGTASSTQRGDKVTVINKS